MHVALFSDCYRPRINGVVTSLISLKTGLEKLGHRVTLIAPSYPNQDDTEPGIVRLNAFSFPTWPEDRAALPLPLSAMRALRSADFDVVHIHTPFNLGVLGWWTASRLKKPMVFTHHTLWEEYSHYLPLVPVWLGKWLAKVICNYFFTRARAIVAPSQDIASQIERLGFGTKTWVAPTGIETALFEGGNPLPVHRELGLQKDAALFIYVGRLAREKSIDFLLQAFAVVVRERPEARFAIVGGGPEQATLEKLTAQLGLQKSVIFLGYRPRAALKNYLAAARLFVFASETETQGLVLLEAAAAGLPVLAIRASGVNEAVHEGVSGLLCDSGELEKYTRAMLDFAQHPERREQFSAAARKWSRNFSAEASANRIAQVYESFKDTPNRALLQELPG